MWVFDTEIGMEKREVTFVPGLYKIVDEILMFVADNKVESIKIDINQEENTISVMSTGKGMEVVWHNAEEHASTIHDFQWENWQNLRS